MYEIVDKLTLRIEELETEVKDNSDKIENLGDGVNSEELANLKNQINSNATSISNLTDKDNSNNIFLKMYPVGSIYVTNESTNPGSIFGGTWVTYGEGRTLVGVDSSQTEFATVGLIGGEKTHLLTIDEMPSHSHYLLSVFYETGQPEKYSYFPLGTGDSDSLGSKNHKTTDTGGSQPHNNLQPYITVYMWKRTA